MLPIDQIICGDNCDVLGTFPRECIDLVVTSPPYDDLRTYGGHDWDFYGVAWQLKRVLKPGGVIVWVVADQTKDGSETGTSFEQALHFKRLGLNLHDTMIYSRPAIRFQRFGHRKYCGAFDFMFVVSNGAPNTFSPIADVRNATCGSVISVPTIRQVDGTQKVSHSAGRRIAEVGTRNNVWSYITGKGHTAEESFVFDHPAAFPEDLAADHIRSWSNEGDIVLDPFNGSGTTTKMARELGRHWIGIDVNEEYCEIARRRMAQQLLPGMGPPVSVSVGGADSVSVPSA